jgi:hypothetical protein
MNEEKNTNEEKNVNGIDFEALAASFLMNVMGNTMDKLDPTGRTRLLAELLYVHKMPVDEIMPFIIDFVRLGTTNPENEGGKL